MEDAERALTDADAEHDRPEYVTVKRLWVQPDQ